MVERMTLLVLILALAIIAAVLWFTYQVLAPYIGMIGQSFAFILLAVTGSIIFLLAGLSLQLYRFVRAKVDRAINHINLLSWQENQGAMYIQEEDGPIHASAMHKSAAISTYALEQAAGSAAQLQEQEDYKQSQFFRDSLETQQSQVKNMITQGKSERAIAGELGISRPQVRKLLGK